MFHEFIQIIEVTQFFEIRCIKFDNIAYYTAHNQSRIGSTKS